MDSFITGQVLNLDGGLLMHMLYYSECCAQGHGA
jgi:hypothetical protein